MSAASGRLTDEVMTALLGHRGFQRLWQEAALDLVVAQETRPTSVIASERPPSADVVCAVKVLDDLASSVHLCVESFLRSLPLARTQSEDRLSREMATLYSVRVQLDRLAYNHGLALPQLRLASRRVAHLLRAFLMQVSTPFPVPSCSIFSASLCDLLYRFEELCAIHDDFVPSESCTRFRKAVDDFHYDVVKRLNVILQQRRPTTAGTCTSGLGTSWHSSLSLATSHTPVRGSPAAMAPAIVFRRTPAKPASQKGYLLSPDLEAVRSRVRRSRSMALQNQSSLRRQEVADIERRWRGFLSPQTEKLILASSSNRDGAESRAALKAACRLTRNVVDEIARRVERM